MALEHRRDASSTKDLLQALVLQKAGELQTAEQVCQCTVPVIRVDESQVNCCVLHDQDIMIQETDPQSEVHKYFLAQYIDLTTSGQSKGIAQQRGNKR